VCLGSIGLGANVPQREASASASEGERFVAGTVVGHHALDLDAEARVVGDRGREESNGATPLLAGHDLGEGNAGMIVDGDVNELPARTDVTAALPLADRSVSGLAETTKFLDIDMDQFAGMVALIAPHRLSRLQRLQ